MIKPTSLQDEIFVVLTLQGQVNKIARRLQKLIADHYDLFADTRHPQLHITIDRIKRSRADFAWKEITNIAKNSLPVKIRINELDCMKMTDNKNFLILDVKKTDSLLRFSNSIHKVLSSKGISTISNYNQWNFHITIVNNDFVNNPIPEEDFQDLCLFVEGTDTSSTSFADKLEIWRPTLNPNLKIVESIKLPDGSEDD